MTGPAWLAGGFAALMIIIAVCCAGRLAICRLRDRDTELDADGLHVLMGVAMAGMLEPRLSLIPATGWRVMFAAGAAWFAWQALRARGLSPGPGRARARGQGLGRARGQGRVQARGNARGGDSVGALRNARHRARPGSGGWRCAAPLPHAVECAAMLYMLQPAGSALAGHGPATTMRGMGGPAGIAGNPALALVLALFMLGYLLWTTDRLTALSRARGGAVQTAAGTRPTAVTPALAIPAPASPAPVTSAPVSPAPASPAPVTSAPVSPASASPAPTAADALAMRRPASASPAPVSPAPASPAPTAADALAMRRPASAAHAGIAGGPVLAPRFAACYKIAMSIAMGYMLILML